MGLGNFKKVIAGVTSVENLMIRPTFSEAFDIFGKRWTGLILATLISGPLHFKEILDAMPQLNESMLSKRLKELIVEDMVTRTVYPETPVRIEYSLTDKGHALYDVLREVHEWADVWME